MKEKIQKGVIYFIAIVVMVIVLIFIFINKNKAINTYSNLSHEYINVYFNKEVSNNHHSGELNINHKVNFENVIIDRILNSKESIDVCVYEINLPRVVHALILKAHEGITVRVIIDAKNTEDEYYRKRDKIMRLYVEKMIRGKDRVIGTKDDIIVFSDSPIFAVTDKELRKGFRLPELDIKKTNVEMGHYRYSGYLLCEGEKRGTNKYYCPNIQMHNKFLVFDKDIVWTGTWNLTVTGTYGNEENMKKRKLMGNIQHCVEIKDKDVAYAYKTEFNEMWGSHSKYPNSKMANFNKRKRDNIGHFFDVDGTIMEVYFSPTDKAAKRVVDLIEGEADHNIYFSMFTFSHNNIIEALKEKYEGEDGIRTGFKIRGIIDEGSWNQRWSASQKMLQGWSNLPAIIKDDYERKFHCKTMIIDGGVHSNPIVITGSMNFTNNGDKTNDENLIIIHDKSIADMFVAEFYSRFLEYVE